MQNEYEIKYSKQVFISSVIIGLIFGTGTIWVMFMRDGIIHLDWGLWVGTICWASAVLRDVINIPKISIPQSKTPQPSVAKTN